MVKKILAVLFLTFVLSFPAMAIEPPEGATIPYEGENTAYTAIMFNEVLEAYGLKFSTEAAQGVPSSFAKVEGDNVTFSDSSMAYLSSDYNAILTAYGLTLMPDKVTSELGKLLDSYATVKDDKVVFSDRVNVAYNPSEWKTILGAYSKAM
ncbi:MAG: hypothetical protein ACR2PB_11450 [Desulfocapsaceae bacterium]